MELTPEQAAVIAARGGDVVVTAGAGSGKTRVLVEHFIGLLDICSLPEIAAVTFTESAAAEMRERVRREVLTRPALRRHRADLDRVVIGTIHSLCLQLLREHPVEAGVDPAFTVLGEDEAEFELRAACAEALEVAADSDDDRAQAIRAVGDYHLSLELPGMLARRDDVRRAFEAPGGATAAERAARLRSMVEEEFEARLAEVAGEAARAAAHAAELLPDGADDALSVLVREVRDRIESAAREGDPRTRESALRDAAGGIRLNAGPRAASWSQAAREQLRRIREAVSGLGRLPRWNDHDEAAVAVLGGLRRLFEDACSRYERRKRARHSLDFLDLEILAARLLDRHTAVAEAYRRRFRYLMVDEFQDTNPLQLEICRLLAGPRDGSPEAVRLFAVGDPKQAIYRFRGSDVRLVGSATEAIRLSGGRALSLSRSFRAHDALVAALNVFFGEIFRAHAHGMPPMSGRGGAAPPGPHLVIAPVDVRAPDGSRAAPGVRTRVEADLVAREIASLLARGAPVWDREAGRLRPIAPGDIAILLRRLQNVHDFEHALESHGIPYATPGGGGFFSRAEIVDLTNLLRWISEPADEVALLGVLRSPMVLLDDPSLLELRGGGRGLFASLAGPPASLAPQMRERALRAHRLLSGLRDRASRLPTHQLVAAVLEESGVEAVWRALAGGEQSHANIRKFIRLARELGDRPLDGFVDYVERRREELGAREGQAVVDHPDAVQLMTVHAAKGLEFPAVFVPEAQVDSRVGWEAVRWRAGEAVSVTLRAEPEATETRRLRPGLYQWLRERDVPEEEAEHDRLLYVAATRAADYLHVSGSDTGSGWLATLLALVEEDPPAGVEVREPAPADAATPAGGPAPPGAAAPPEGDEEEYLSPLVARPPVIPIRASTPVTALRRPVAHPHWRGHDDGLGRIRGTVAHRALELTFREGARPDVEALVRLASGRLVAAADVRRLSDEVSGMLDRFEGSPLARTLRDPATRRYFELPFAWDWDGVPVHGSIDLLYRDASGWHLVDFKSDDLSGRTARDAAAPYLAQLALYGGAVERALRERPSQALLFLRTGELYAPGEEELRGAMAEARVLVERGAPLVPELGDLDEAEPPGE